MNTTPARRGTIIRIDPHHLVVQDERGELHWLSFHGQVATNVERTPGAPVALRTVTGPTYSLVMASPWT